MVERLFKGGEDKKLKQLYYESELTKRISEQCTFTPRAETAKTVPTVRLYSNNAHKTNEKSI